MLLAAMLGFAWLAAWAAPETRTGAALRRWTIIAPARWLDRITRGHLLIATGIGLLLLGADWLGHDALAVVTMGSPELLGALGSIELSVWIDALAGAVLASTRGVGLVRHVRPRRPAKRARRARRPGARPPAANDDDRPSPAIAA